MRLSIPTLLVALLVVLSGFGPAALAGTATAQEDCSFPVTETDASGTEVSVEEPPERIVTLAPSASQMLWEIGADEKVVGVDQHSAYLDGADEKANVSGSGEQSISVEKVIDQEPDLVLAPDVVSEETVEQLRDAGLTVYWYEGAESIDTVSEQTELTGRLVDECDGASETVDEMNDRIGAVEEAIEDEDRPRVLYVFFGFTAGEGTFIDDIIETAGGENVAAEAGIEGYQEINDETIVDQDPEWIVLNSDDPMVPPTEAYNATTAVQEDQTVVLETNTLNQPGPRVVEPIEELAQALHPEAFEDGGETTQTESSTPTATAESTETATATTTETTDSSGQPGFATGVALAGIALAGLLVRRG